MSFSSDLNRFARSSTANMGLVKRGICLKLFGAVVESTPVDTGRLRGNWQASISQPIEVETESTAKKDALAAIESALAPVAADDKTVFLSNNVPYAGIIESGKSKQAPEGMMRPNVIRFQAIVDKALGGV